VGNRDLASTFTKGLQVLNCFESGRSDLSMAEISHLTGFDRATSRRLCLTLEDSGYLVKSGRIFRLSPRIVAVAGGYLSSHEIGKSAQPILNQFAEELNGEIALAIRDGTRAIYIARSAVSSARLSLGLSIGSTLPLLSTAVGRCLLASCQPELRENLVNECHLERHTETTDMDKASILTKVESAAHQGYAVVIGEFEQGAAGVAVPTSRIGGVETVLATSTTANQAENDDQFNKITDTLRRASMSLRS